MTGDVVENILDMYRALKRVNKNGGFTVVEMMVAAGFFVVVLGIVVGGFTSAIRAQRDIAALISVNNNMGLVLEQIAREIRVGRNFCLRVDEMLPNCPPGQDISVLPWSRTNSRAETVVLEFQRLRGSVLTTVHYEWDAATKTIYRKEGATALDVSLAEREPITASNVVVGNLNFIVSNKKDNYYPWRFTISATVSPMGVAAGTIPEQTIQTTVSPRFLPNEDVGAVQCRH